MGSPNGRYFVNTDGEVPIPDYHEELLASLTRINLYNPPVQTCSTGWRLQGFFQGPTSIAYLFYKLFLVYPNLDFKGQSLLDWAQAYLELTKFETKQTVDAGHCGIANETLASLALNIVMSKDTSLIHEICAYSSTLTQPEESGSNEWLYGRAGYLYFLRLVKVSFPDNRTIANTIDITIAKVVDRILRSPQPWTWYGKAYLGAAHGSIGILAQLMLSVGSEQGRFDRMVDQLISLQFDSGNFPSSLDHSTAPDELVQFCHGGPGFLLALQSISEAGSRFELDKVMVAARADTWSRGLLTKTPCLCHGIAGNALALADKKQFDHFLAHMTTAQLEARGWLADAGHTDQFAGLFGGEAGRAWVWAVADRGLPKTCIGFNDL